MPTNAELLADLDRQRAALATAPPNAPAAAPAPPAPPGYPPPPVTPPAYVSPWGAPAAPPPLPPMLGLLVQCEIETPKGKATVLVQFGPEAAANPKGLVEALQAGGVPVKCWTPKGDGGGKARGW